MGNDVSHIISHIISGLDKYMRRSFTTNEFYHIFDRGVDKRKIFLDKRDHIRFVHDLYEFNDVRPAPEFSRCYSKNVGNDVSHLESLRIRSFLEKDQGEGEKDKRDILVKIHAFVLMTNHHHLLVEQVKDDGISLFIRKVHGGYSRAFNLRYKRIGHLFQGPFKSIHIKDDIYLAFLICYLHANPLDLWKKNWKEKQLTDKEIKEALKFLEKYRWSSHSDYLGLKNFPSLINKALISKEFLLEFFDGREGYKDFFVDWLSQYKKNINYLKELIFD